jgi:putative glutamine amidotransferase
MEGTRRPVVGVTSIPKEAVSGFGPNPHETVPEFYLRMLALAGAAPILLPVHAGWHEEVESVLDAVVLTGGGDVDPAAYGRERGPAVYGVDPSRDDVEFRLVRWAVDRDVPLLAVCRGTQAMNVALGGTLVQDIATEVAGALDHVRTDHHDGPVHDVRIEPGSLLAELLGSDSAHANSMHHQAVEAPGAGVRVVATAPDGVVEGIEVPAARFALGVQWHPECLGPGDPSFGIFEGLVRAAAKPRT